LSLKDYEIGVENWRGYTLGSRIESKPDAQFVTVVHRIVNGSNVISTIDWHSAFYREPMMQPGELRDVRHGLYVKGIGGFLHWPIPFDYFHYGEHSVTIETSMGILHIDGAPAFQPRFRVWTLEAKLLLKELFFEIVVETVIKTKTLNMKFLSQAKGNGKVVEYVSKIQNNSEKEVHIQWLGLSTKKDPFGIMVSLPKKMGEARTVSKGESKWPIYIVNDVALINMESIKFLPGSIFSFLGRDPNFESRRREIRKLKLGENSVMIAPVITSIE